MNTRIISKRLGMNDRLTLAVQPSEAENVHLTLGSGEYVGEVTGLWAEELEAIYGVDPDQPSGDFSVRHRWFHEGDLICQKEPPDLAKSRGVEVDLSPRTREGEIVIMNESESGEEIHVAGFLTVP